MNCEDILENVVSNLEKQAGLPALRQLPAVIPGKKGLSGKAKALLAAGAVGAGAAGYGTHKALKKEAGLPALRQLPAVIPGKKGLSAKAKALLAAGGIAGAGAAGYGAHKALNKKAAEEITVKGQKYRKGTIGSAAGKTALTLGGINAALAGGVTKNPRLAAAAGAAGALSGAIYGGGYGAIRGAIRGQNGVRSASGEKWESLKAKASHKK